MQAARFSSAVGTHSVPIQCAVSGQSSLELMCLVVFVAIATKYWKIHYALYDLWRKPAMPLYDRRSSVVASSVVVIFSCSSGAHDVALGIHTSMSVWRPVKRRHQKDADWMGANNYTPCNFCNLTL